MSAPIGRVIKLEYSPPPAVLRNLVPAHFLMLPDRFSLEPVPHFPCSDRAAFHWTFTVSLVAAIEGRIGEQFGKATPNQRVGKKVRAIVIELLKSFAA